MKVKGVNYKVLDGCDFVFTGGKKPFDYISRIVTSKFKDRRNHEMATHVGIIIKVWNQLLIAEMNGRSGHLEINPLDKYLNENKRFILDIKRSTELQYVIPYRAIQSQIALDYRRTLEYDYKGLLEFVSNKVKDDKDRYYCSEYVYELTKNFIDYPKEFADKVSPKHLQNFEGLESVRRWKQ